MKAIIFDMDGVLINSTKYVWESFNKLLEKYGVHFTKKDIKKYLGMSMRDKLNIWKKEYNIQEEINPLEFSKEAFKIELKLVEKELRPNKIILDLIDSAKNKNIKIAVATSSTNARAIKILELLKIKERLDYLVTAEDIEKHKPNPQIFLKAAEEIGISPKECVVFEDAVNGIQAAKSAGMKSIAILTEFTSKEDFENLSNLTIKDFSEISLEDLEKI